MAVVSLARAGSEVLRSSFRDPAGCVFQVDGIIHRRVNPAYKDHYDTLMRSGLYAALTQRGLLVRHTEVAPQGSIDLGAYRVLRPERIPFISYPYEWCFSQLKDAALATLAIQRLALEHGMSLKDSSAYNVQFVGSRPVLIDTLSFERYEDGSPWAAYRQFCQHFLAPLALMSLVDVELGRLLRIHIDGVPLQLASRLLPWHSWLRPSLLLHLHAHAGAQRRFAPTAPVANGPRRMSRAAMLGLLDNLRKGVERLTWEPRRTTWADYEQHTNYSDEARRHKESLVTEFLGATRARTVWDLGANAGRFSRLAATMGASVVAFDSDFGAVELSYRACRESGERAIVPLVLDLANPSPAIGWAHEERSSWTDRGPVDAVLALALVHHLAIGNNVPLERVAELLHRVARCAIVEFIPRSDSQVARLLATRKDVFGNYSQDHFERAFERYFRIRRREPVCGSERLLYLMERA
jgi:ribosomal protein L11 methylase PrmA